MIVPGCILTATINRGQKRVHANGGRPQSEWRAPRTPTSRLETVGEAGVHNNSTQLGSDQPHPDSEIWILTA